MHSIVDFLELAAKWQRLVDNERSKIARTSHEREVAARAALYCEMKRDNCLEQASIMMRTNP